MIGFVGAGAENFVPHAFQSSNDTYEDTGFEIQFVSPGELQKIRREFNYENKCQALWLYSQRPHRHSKKNAQLPGDLPNAMLIKYRIVALQSLVTVYIVTGSWWDNRFQTLRRITEGVLHKTPFNATELLPPMPKLPWQLKTPGALRNAFKEREKEVRQFIDDLRKGESVAVVRAAIALGLNLDRTE